jgi:hypothetical protein
MPRRQGHGVLSLPTATTAMQGPDAIVREKGCRVVIILVVGFWRNDRKEKKEESWLNLLLVKNVATDSKPFRRLLTFMPAVVGDCCQKLLTLGVAL